MAPDFEALIKALTTHDVKSVIIGGLAMVVHGSTYITEDIDIAYERDQHNIERLVAALEPFHPRLRVRGEPNGLAFRFDVTTIKNGANFTLVTDVGNVDILAHIDGYGSFKELESDSERVEAFGYNIAVLSIDGLIRAKRASARPKDLLAIPELEVLKEVHEQRSSTRPKQ
ncbi:MAG: hypothetical protein JO165_13930 [Candidatus Eremiobacteraeota bacterium]|nr:hypothetical protein [Candidatus Eremiobacteraeota bacterium]